jgi:exonuclease SbcD
MIRIFHSADWHIDERCRLSECQRVLNELVSHVEHEKPDLFVCAGDIYTRRSTALERAIAHDIFMRIAMVCPVVAVRGNHDDLLDIEALTRLRAAYPIWGVEEPRVITVAGVAVACLPWPSKANVVLHAQNLDLDAAECDVQDHLMAILRYLADELDTAEDPCDHMPHILVAHAMIGGSKTASDQPLVGCDFELSTTDIVLQRTAEAVMLGHVHMQQEWGEVGDPIVYPGSPYHSDFGDRGDKGYVVWTLGDGPPIFERRKLSATPMYQFVTAYTPELGFGSELMESNAEPSYPCEMKVSYAVDAEHASKARAEAEAWKLIEESKGARVLLDPQINVTTRARAPEVAKAMTTRGQLEAYWDSIDKKPEREAVERLLEKLSKLEMTP